MTVEEYIRSLQLHDMPLRGIHFDFQHRKVIVHYSPYDEHSGNYIDRTLTFCAVDKIKMDSFFPEWEPSEIFNADVAETEAGHSVALTFLSDFGGPSYNLAFEFLSIEELK